jgi:hypothetical protein
MTRYGSAHRNVRTRVSPPCCLTSRMNVLHGTKSITWANSVLPTFMRTSPERPRRMRTPAQIDTTNLMTKAMENQTTKSVKS